LIDAVAYFCLPGLCKKAQDVVGSSIKENPVLWFPARGSFGASTNSALEESAFEVIRAKPTIHFESESVALLSESQMGKILKDERVEADEHTLFLIIQAWANANEGEKDGGSLDATTGEVNRKSQACCGTDDQVTFLSSALIQLTSLLQ
jgi:hypothetical protein